MRRLALVLLCSLLLVAAAGPLAANAAPLLARVLRIVDGAGDVGQYTSLELDSAGNPVISYYSTTGGNLMLAHCSDPTCSGPVARNVVDSLGDVGWYTSLALDSAGNPVISYYDGSNLTLKLAHCSDPDCSGAVAVNLVDDGNPTSNNVGQHTSLVLDGAGNPVISYHDEDNGDLKLAVCGDPDCTLPATLVLLAQTGDVGAANSLALDGAGRPVVSYWDTSNSELGLATCSDAVCTIVTLASLDTNVQGNATSLVLDAFDFPVISYQTSSGLKLLHCSDPACNSATGSMVDPAGNPLYNSLALDSNRNPVIGYFNFSTGELMLAECDDPDCITSTLSTLDSGSGSVGYYVSLELGCSDTPVLSYLDIANQDLKLASDDTCMPLSASTTATAPKTSTHIASTGLTSLGLGRRIIVYVPAEAIPPGQSDCTLAIREQEEAKADFDLDDTAWDVTITCNGKEQHIFYAPITVCIRPLDGVLSDKQVFHRHNSSGFRGIFGGEEIGPDAFVCGQTRLLSLFTLAELSLPATGFIPGQVTQLRTQPAELAYSASDLVLTLPTLDLELDIVGVPRGVNGWDVSWLASSQVGYLYGTAFPIWEGNSVLTAHVWNADNTPGPFHGLKDLTYGDQFSISAYGYIYTYEVRSNQLVTPGRLSVLNDSDYNMVTLITCESFNEVSRAYRYRRAVKAVLVAVR